MTSQPLRGAEPSWQGTAASVAAVGVVVLAIATFFAFLDGLWWVFDLVVALRFQYALGFLLLAIVFGFLRRRIGVVVSLVGFLINAAFVVPLYLGGSASAEGDGEVLRVMFLNTGIDGTDPIRLVDDLRTADHDLVFFSATSEYLLETIQASSTPYTVVQSRPSGVDVELLVLARQGLPVETTLVDFGMGGRDFAVQASVDLGDATVQVLAMHPVSPVGATRSDQHERHFADIASWTARQDDPVLVVGDLNSTPWSADFRRLLRDGGLLDSLRGHGVQASWPSLLGPFGIPIDHALHSDGLIIVERSLGPGYGSDHKSVHVAVSLADPGEG